MSKRKTTGNPSVKTEKVIEYLGRSLEIISSLDDKHTNLASRKIAVAEKVMRKYLEMLDKKKNGHDVW